GRGSGASRFSGIGEILLQVLSAKSAPCAWWIVSRRLSRNNRRKVSADKRFISFGIYVSPGFVGDQRGHKRRRHTRARARLRDFQSPRIADPLHQGCVWIRHVAAPAVLP